MVGSLTVDMFSLSVSSQAGADKFDKGYVTLSFDDGWSSAYRNVMPKLNTAGLKGSFYVITNEANVADDSEINDPNAYLTYSKLKEMQNAGHEVTAHTRTHVSLLNLNDQQANSEINGSRSDLIGQGFTPVDTFAYPYGDHNATAEQRVKNAGFAGARSVDEGYNTKATNKYALKVQNVLMGTTAAQMKAWIDQAVQDKTWLNIVFHQVDNLQHTSEEDYSTTPAILQQVIDYLKSKNVSVITTHQGIQMMP
jgi:peptidoglycan/xylan/chitin deacetylase (PgdA/CDA1 family)